MQLASLAQTPEQGFKALGNQNTMGFKQQLRYSGLLGPTQRGSTSAGSTDPIPQKSKLAILLLEKWAWGAMTLPLLQIIAEAAVHDGADHPLLRCSYCFGGFGSKTVC